MLIPALFIITLISVLLGCGAPTLAAYALVAMVTAPMLTKMGVPLVAAHMFIFYFAVFSAVTPPVATGAVVAAGIAGSSYLRTAVTACRLVIPSFILPWLFVWNTTLLGFFKEPLIDVMSLAATVALIVIIQAVGFGQLFTSLNVYERLLGLISACILFACIVLRSYILFPLGLVLFVGMMFLQVRKRNRFNKLNNEDLLALDAQPISNVEG